MRAPSLVSYYPNDSLNSKLQSNIQNSFNVTYQGPRSFRFLIVRAVADYLLGTVC